MALFFCYSEIDRVYTIFGDELKDSKAGSPLYETFVNGTASTDSFWKVGGTYLVPPGDASQSRETKDAIDDDIIKSINGMHFHPTTCRQNIESDVVGKGNVWYHSKSIAREHL